MTRRKVKLAFIADDSARKACYNKRKKGLLKKVHELTTLCGIPACAIISSPFDSEAEIWPNQEGAEKLIQRYQNSSMKDESRNVNHEMFLMQRISKVRDQVRKLKHDNREKELNHLMFEFMQNNNLSDALTAEELNDLDKVIDKKLKEVNNKIATLDSS